ncbi:MAG: DUF975 family protein [Clostridiales bacterium]
MWIRKELKQNAKTAIKKNYWYAIAVCFILAILIGRYPMSTILIHQYDTGEELPDSVVVEQKPTTNSEIVNNYLDKFVNISDNVFYHKTIESTKGFLGTAFNNITQSKSFIFGILNSINQAVFNDRIGVGITILIGALLNIAFILFICNILKVGECRFFLENRKYCKTRISRILYLYKIRKIWNPAKILFFRDLYLGLWSLTVVGVCIKFYSYKMVPFIVAENPLVSKKEAFALSRKMMDGNKWQAFVLDMSFIGWTCLEILTSGIVGLFFVNSYVAATQAELYIALRQIAIAENYEYSNNFNDPYLTALPTADELKAIKADN